MRSPASQSRKLLAPTIPVGFLDDVLLAARHRGRDVDAVLRSVGLSLDHLGVPGLRVSVEVYSEVLRRLGALLDDAFLGFLSTPIPRRAFDVFARGLVGCRRLSEVVAHANEFYALFTDELRWTLLKPIEGIRPTH